MQFPGSSLSVSMSDDNGKSLHSPSCQALITSLHTNLIEIDLFLKVFEISFVSYLEQTGGVPAEPLELPAKYMDRSAWLKETTRLIDELQAARESQNPCLIKEAVQKRWMHVFFKRPIDADNFRSQLGALIDQRYSLMLAMKSHEEYYAVGFAK